MVVLFDIDGTLLDTHGAGRRAFECALERLTGRRGLLDHISFAGNTDLGVVRRLVEENGFQWTPADIQALWTFLAEELRHSLAAHPAAEIPGAAALLNRLSAEGIAMGLVTGNIREGAFIKLASIGFEPHFSFGGFGDTHENRNMIAREALKDGLIHGRIKESDPAVLIGDTPYDVAAGKSIGVPVLAVASNPHFQEDALKNAGADAVIPDLQNTDAILSWVLKNATPAARAD